LTAISSTNFLWKTKPLDVWRWCSRPFPSHRV